MAVPSQRNIKRTIAALRKIVEESPDPVMVRMAYFAENTLRWSIEDTRGWKRPEIDLALEVKLLKEELDSHDRS